MRDDVTLVQSQFLSLKSDFNFLSITQCRIDSTHTQTLKNTFLFSSSSFLRFVYGHSMVIDPIIPLIYRNKFSKYVLIKQSHCLIVPCSSSWCGGWVGIFASWEQKYGLCEVPANVVNICVRDGWCFSFYVFTSSSICIANDNADDGQPLTQLSSWYTVYGARWW